MDLLKPKAAWRSKKLWAYVGAQCACVGLLAVAPLDPWAARILASGLVFNAVAYVGGEAWLDRARALILAAHGKDDDEVK